MFGLDEDAMLSLVATCNASWLRRPVIKREMGYRKECLGLYSSKSTSQSEAGSDSKERGVEVASTPLEGCSIYKDRTRH